MPHKTPRQQRRRQQTVSAAPHQTYTPLLGPPACLSHAPRNLSIYHTRLARRGADDPRAMLRAINPREAALLDAAAGAHVRFRLGGVNFPPQVYYKIFTHRPVAG